MYFNTTFTPNHVLAHCILTKSSQCHWPMCPVRTMRGSSMCCGSFTIGNSTPKKKNLLISPAIFDPSLCENHDRARGNIKYLQNLWLDFEKGDLPPDELPNLFPNLRMVISNTYSHTADNPRFRVMIPTARSLTPETYELLYNQIAWKLEDAGYGLKEKDTGKPRSR